MRELTFMVKALELAAGGYGFSMHIVFLIDSTVAASPPLIDPRHSSCMLVLPNESNFTVRRNSLVRSPQLHVGSSSRIYYVRFAANAQKLPPRFEYQALG